MDFDADTILKAVLIFAISISILIVSYQFAKLLLELRGLLKSFREVVDNSVEVADSITNDYFSARNFVAKIADLKGDSKFFNKLFEIGFFSAIIGFVKNYLNKKKSKPKA